MPLRMRKSVRLGKGVRLNLSKRGASFSVGGKGMTTNISSKGVRHSASIPGTGIGYTTGGKGKRAPKRKGCGSTTALIVLVVVLAVMVVR